MTQKEVGALFYLLRHTDHTEDRHAFMNAETRLDVLINGIGTRKFNLSDDEVAKIMAAEGKTVNEVYENVGKVEKFI